MKKVKLTTKLSLNKETVAKLNSNQLNAVQGGVTQNTCTCFTDCDGCTPPASVGCPPPSALCATALCATENCTTPGFDC